MAVTVEPMTTAPFLDAGRQLQRSRKHATCLNDKCALLELLRQAKSEVGLHQMSPVSVSHTAHTLTKTHEEPYIHSPTR